MSTLYEVPLRTVRRGKLVSHFLAVLMLVAPAVADAQLVRSAAGANAAAIQTAVSLFRTDLGLLNANVSGSFGTGRREINWDGVPDIFAAPNNLPANFFNANSPRGAVFSTPGTGFQVSAKAVNPTSTPVDFANIDASYSRTFEAFSAQRMFTALASNIVDVRFFVAGSSAAAQVRGFGSVFSDVDLANTTSIEYFGVNNNSLGVFNVTQFLGSETFSFLGVSFNTPSITRVRITSGNAALGAGVTDQDGNLRDLVVMDDFIYGEPNALTATPEPASMVLTATGLLMVIGISRRSRARRRDANS